MADLNRFQSAQEVQIVSEDGREAIPPVSSVFWASIDRTVSNTETPVVLLRNPLASGKTVYLDKIIISISTFTNAAVLIKLFGSPIVTGAGVSGIVAPGLIGGGVGVATIFSGPTVSSNGVRLFAASAPGGLGTQAVVISTVDLIQLPAGKDILLTCLADGANRLLTLSFQWREI